MSYVMYYLARPWRGSDAELLADLRTIEAGKTKKGVSSPIAVPHIEMIGPAFRCGLNEYEKSQAVYRISLAIRLQGIWVNAHRNLAVMQALKVVGDKIGAPDACPAGWPWKA